MREGRKGVGKNEKRKRKEVLEKRREREENV